jgi:hypothetical protein
MVNVDIDDVFLKNFPTHYDAGVLKQYGHRLSWADAQRAVFATTSSAGRDTNFHSYVKASKEDRFNFWYRKPPATKI